MDSLLTVNCLLITEVDISRIQNRQGMLEQQYLKPLQEAIEIIFAL